MQLKNKSTNEDIEHYPLIQRFWRPLSHLTRDHQRTGLA